MAISYTYEQAFHLAVDAKVNHSERPRLLGCPSSYFSTCSYQ